MGQPIPSNGPRDAINPECYTRHTQKSVLILGDSNAADGCLTYLGNDRKTSLITLDNSHLRPFASVYLAQKQLLPMIVNALRSDEANAATR